MGENERAIASSALAKMEQFGFAGSQVVRVHFSNGSSKIFSTDASTTVAHVLEGIADRLLLRMEALQFFSLWAVGKTGVQVELPPQLKLCHVVQSWSEMECIYKGRSGADVRIFFRRRALATNEAEGTLADQAALDLLYEEAVKRVLESPLPFDMESSTHLAGLQMQITYGNYRRTLNQSGFLEEKLYAFMPHLKVVNRSRKQVEKIEKAIFEQHQLHNGRSDLLLKMLYLEKARTSPVYGANLFELQHIVSNGKAVGSKHILSISHSVILVIESAKKTVVGCVSCVDPPDLTYRVKMSERGMPVFLMTFADKKKRKQSYEFFTREAPLIGRLFSSLFGAVTTVPTGEEHTAALISKAVVGYCSGVLRLKDQDFGGRGMLAEGPPRVDGDDSSEDGLLEEESDSSDGVLLGSYWG